MIRWIGIWPVWVTTTDVMPENVAGRYVDLFNIEIKSGYEKDEGLIQHELKHVVQRLKRNLSPWEWGMPIDHKTWEIEAYQVQLQYYPQDTPERHTERRALFAYFLANNYEFSITQAEADRRLQ